MYCVLKICASGYCCKILRCIRSDYIGPSLATIVFSINQFDFYGFEKGFREGIIITVTLAAHTLNQAIFIQLLSKEFTHIQNTGLAYFFTRNTLSSSLDTFCCRL